MAAMMASASVMPPTVQTTLLSIASAAARAGECLGAVYNPGAHTHTSIAIHDAIEGAELPVIEVHISNVHAREEFRHHSYVSGVATAVIAGAGTLGYELALRVVAERLSADRT